MKSIGIFGGTFDPIHYGHLRLAEEMLELAALQEVRFIPTGKSAHRSSPQASAQQRRKMVELAITDCPAFTLDERELNRKSNCYTVDTLIEIRHELKASQSVSFLMGGDAFLQLHTWHQWQKLFDLAHIVVGCRPGFNIEEEIISAPLELRQQYQTRISEISQLHSRSHGNITLLNIPKLDISATLIRNRIANNRSIRYLLPPTVADYIQQQHLYTPC